MIYLQLLLTFFKIGLFTFGGGYAMLPLIQSEVAANNWISQADLVNFIAVSESTPGPFAINIATYIGSQVAGIIGSVCATLGVVLPSFIIILIVAHFYTKFKENNIVKGCMSGLKPAVVGLIGAALLRIGFGVFFPESFSVDVFSSSEFYISFFVFISMSILVFKKINPIIIIVISALLGISAGYLFNL